MILEDDSNLLDLEEMILTYEGYDVTPIRHYESIEYLLDFLPEMILLDVRLGDGYGNSLCQEIKNNPDTAEIPVILISGSNNLQRLAKECNADDFLSKPFNNIDLVKIVKKYDCAKEDVN